jgi:hypothetical protein
MTMPAHELDALITCERYYDAFDETDLTGYLSDDFFDEDKSIVEITGALIESDEEDSRRASRRLRYLYAEGNQKTRDVIDTAFIALCGVSLRTILRHAKNEKSGEGEEV